MIVLVITVVAVLWINQRRLTANAVAWGQQVLRAQETERERIASDLHDDVVQRLATVRLLLENAQEPDATRVLQDVTGDLRRLAHDLYPPSLQHLSLTQALQELACARPAGSVPSVSVIGGDGLPTLSRPVMIALFRTAQESLQNAIKHAEAQTVRIALRTVPAGVELTIADDGRGISDLARARTSFGLRSMRERVAAIGGTLTIGAAIDGPGTRVSVTVPVA